MSGPHWPRIHSGIVGRSFNPTHSFPCGEPVGILSLQRSCRKTSDQPLWEELLSSINGASISSYFVMQKVREKIFLARLICQNPVRFIHFKCTRHYMICGCLDLVKEFIFKLIKYAFLVADAVYFNKDSIFVHYKYSTIQTYIFVHFWCILLMRILLYLI